MRIHSLADHFDVMMRRDIQSKMGLSRLVMERAKVLKYLKRYDLNRYVQCLSDIGVEQRAVEGEIIMRKKVLGAQ
jgi:small subunit ribosomal protein S15